jgi:APA family basic amino acid/polyamine antiporter
MVVANVVGVGIFLTPATMLRTLGSPAAATALWLAVGLLSAAGALCYAELATRFPQAGGGYVFLREGYGPRTAFLHGWMSFLVIDPGLTAALGLGFSQYSLALVGAPASWNQGAAMAAVVAFGAVTLMGVGVSAALVQWTAAAKLTAVGALVVAALARPAPPAAAVAASTPAVPGMEALAAAVIAAFFAFGGWWELGRMAGEIARPRRAMPRALVGGIALVASVYVVVSLGFMRAAAGQRLPSDEALVSAVGTSLFGPAGAAMLTAIVVVAVGGSLAATLLGSPRLYLAMARDGLLPCAVARFDALRGTAPWLTLAQVVLACIYIALGSFDQILGYFVPAAVLFLGLSAAVVLRLPRPDENEVFRAPLHPAPILLFLVLVVLVLALFIAGQPGETAVGGGVLLLGLAVAPLVVRRRATGTLP